MAEPPTLQIINREWRMTGVPLPGSTDSNSFYAGPTGTLLENMSAAPIVLQTIRLTARFNCIFGGPIEKVWEKTDVRLIPGGQLQLKAPRAPLFSSLSSHTLQLVATYNGVRYRLDNYRRTDLIAVTQPLTIHLLDREWN